MRPIKRLWIVYDPSCGLCSRINDWIAQQPAFVPIDLVVGDQGDVWLGNRAWIVVL